MTINLSKWASRFRLKVDSINSEWYVFSLFYLLISSSLFGKSCNIHHVPCTLLWLLFPRGCRLILAPADFFIWSLLCILHSFYSSGHYLCELCRNPPAITLPFHWSIACYNFTYSEPWPHLFYSSLRPDRSWLILYDTLTALSVSLTVEFPLLNYFSHDYSALLRTYSFPLTLLTDRLGLCARPISI